MSNPASSVVVETSSLSSSSEASRGVFFALGAYTCWGLFPLYWKLLKAYPSLEILGHRILWSFVFYLGLLVVQARWSLIKDVVRDPRARTSVFFSAVLIGVNWLLYIYAVNAGFVLQSSLGYFITPLLNVLLGSLLLGEKLSRLRWTAVVVAAVGVLILGFQAQSFPWIALALASTFAVYGLVRKRVVADALAASTLETAYLVVPALIALVYARAATPVPLTLSAGLLFVLSGVITGVPLLWFAQAARRLPLSTLGFFQYIAPILQFAIAVFIYKEEFTPVHARAFACIWFALGLYSWDAHRRRREARVA